MKPVVLSFILLMFFTCASGQKIGKTLYHYIEIAKHHSPLLNDYRNQVRMEQDKLQRLKAMYRHSHLELNGDYLFVPVVSKDNGRTSFRWNARDAADYYGYDLGESSGFLHAGVTWTQPLLGNSSYKVAQEQAKINLPESDVTEFVRLNHTLTALMYNSLTSYRTQKEFTENASHELQTPLAVFQSKLDLLLQQPDLTRQQADLMQGLYETSNRLSRLNRNLLLLAKIDNHQYEQMENIGLSDFLDRLLSSQECLMGNIVLHKDFQTSLTIRANRTLLESLVNNLVVNAVRHNRPNGEISLVLTGRQLTVSNISDELALDGRQVFNRFYRSSEKAKGSGLGLAIVKAVCEYHGWTVCYRYKEGMHCFTIEF